MEITEQSLRLTEYISEKIDGQTFHHHFHILYDIACSYDKSDHLVYLEIGCYAGASACLVLQRPNTTVITIDLGDPISPEIVKKNISNLNIHENKFIYLHGDSQSQIIQEQLREIIESVDILFIDGNHFYDGVRSDFYNYKDLVKANGYIVFDDYNDDIHSPEVKLAINSIIEKLPTNFEIIGTLPNKFGARPSTLLDGNLFILKKL